MSSINNNKDDLPKDWIVVKSTSYPDRVYYFNVRTAKTSWTPPNNDTETSKTEKPVRNRRESRNVSQARVHKARSPSPDDLPLAEAIGRRISGATQKQTVPKVLETPQMIALRAKIAEGKLKSRAKGKSKTNNNNMNSTLDSASLRADESKQLNRRSLPANATATATATTADVLETSVMKEIREKLIKRKSKSGSTRQSMVDKISTGSSIGQRNMPRVDEESADEKSSAPLTFGASKMLTTKRVRNQRENLTTILSVKSPIVNRNIKTEPTISTPINDPEQQKNMTSLKRQKSGLSSCSSITNTTPSCSKSDDDWDSGTTLTGSLKKNIAAKRLKTLKRKLSLEQREPKIDPSPSRCNLDAGSPVHDDLPSGLFQSPKIQPTIHTNSESRNRVLRTRLESRFGSPKSPVNPNPEQSAKAPKIAKPIRKAPKALPKKVVAAIKDTVHPKLDIYVKNSAETTDINEFHEEMDWQPIQEERIINEIQEVRMQLFSEQNTDSRSSRNPTVRRLDLSKDSEIADKRILYIVVDTNVFLSNLKLISQLVEDELQTHYNPVLVIPWTVMQELDYIKDNKSGAKSVQLQYSARRAVQLLFKYFSNNNQRVKGQTPSQVETNRSRFAVECPDDEILQCCLNIREFDCDVVLLSNDKNLCNKAMIHSISTFEHRDSVEKILGRKMSAPETVSRKRYKAPEPLVEHFSIPANIEAHHELAEEIFEEVKAIVKSFLSEIVGKELEKLYGENWKKYTIIQPPWSAVDVLKCALKHWIAVISDVLAKEAETLIHELLKIFNAGEKYCQNIKDVNNILMKCQDLSQMVKANDYRELGEKAFYSIKALIDQSRGSTSGPIRDKLQNARVPEKERIYDEERIENTFSYFEEIWSFTNSFCGVAADMLGIPHSIAYKKFNHTPSFDTIQRMQPEVALNLNQLIDALRAVLNSNEDLTPTHPLLLNLHLILSTYLRNSGNLLETKSLDPADLLCCVNAKKDLLRSGMVQLQELNYQFCRMADFQAT